jgi:hypothetical protein
MFAEVFKLFLLLQKKLAAKLSLFIEISSVHAAAIVKNVFKTI